MLAASTIRDLLNILLQHRTQITNWRSPWKVASCAENLGLQALQLQEMNFCLKFLGEAHILQTQ